MPQSSESLPGLARTDDEVQAKLVKIWENTLRQRPIFPTDDYFQLGGTSLQAVRIFAQINEEFGVKLTLSAFLRAQTIQELAETIRESGAATSSSCLVEIQSGGSRPRFFCVHGADGSVLRYRDLARRLGMDQPFYALQAQGMDGTQPLLKRVEDMATRYLGEIQGLQPEGPYYLGGYCGGGTIAFEIAQRLHGQGQKVAILALLDTYNWAQLRGSWPTDIYFNLELALYRCKNFALLNFRDKLKFLRRNISEVKKLFSFRTLAERTSNNPDRQPATPAQLAKVNDHAILSYIPKVYPGRIYHFCPMEKCTRYRRPELGWDELAADGVDTFVVPVYPGGMLVEPFVRELANKLRTCLDAAVEMGDSLSHRVSGGQLGSQSQSVGSLAEK